MKDPLQITERELIGMTRDLDAMHNDLFPTFTGLMDEINDQTRSAVERVRALAGRDASRRNFLAGGLITAGALGGGMLLSACGASDTSASGTPAADPNDLLVAQLAASIEILAINAYTAALAAAGAGSLGKVPPAVNQFATTAKRQHEDHRDAWNNSLTSAGKPAQTAPDPKLDATVKTGLAAVRTIGDVAKLALMLETVAVQTYAGVAGSISDAQLRAVALSISPVEAQHVAILNFVIGTYPVPESFAKTDQARTTADVS